MADVDNVVDMSAASMTPDGTTYVEAGAGRPIVFVHGVGMNRRVWEPQLTAFAGAFHTVAYDLLGHGGSPLPPDPARLAHLSDQLARLLDHLGLERTHIVGHSMGCLIALDFALRQPQRVDRLVALNAVYRRSPAQRASAVERARQLEGNDVDHALEATLERWFEPDRGTSNQYAIERVRDWLGSVDRRGYARIYRLFATADDAFVGRLGELAAPALFATGELDPNSTPAMSRRMAEEAPAGKAAILEGKRHMMAFVAANLVNRHIGDFLQDENIRPPHSRQKNHESPGPRRRKSGQHAMEARMADQPIDPLDLRKALGAFMTGVTVVTTLDETGSPRGFTANSFTSVSLDPPLILVCVAHSAFSYPLYATTEHFAVNILAEGQKDVSGLFAGKDADKFSSVRWERAATGSPVLDGSVAWVDCRVHDRVESGDHLIVIGRVVEFRHSAENPLGYCRGAYLTSELEQEAMPAPGQPMQVGAILERDAQVLLLKDPETGKLALPCGARLGRPSDPNSLQGRLDVLQIDAEIGFIFAVFEDDHTGTLSVYYRGQLRRADGIGEGVELYAFDAIPWERLPDPAVCSMLRRYVDERTEDRFGIYVGDFDRGQVQRLAKDSG